MAYPKKAYLIISYIISIFIVFANLACTPLDSSEEDDDEDSGSVLGYIFDDDDEECYPPEDCITEEPQYGYVNIMLTTNAENSDIRVNIYRGYYEDGDLWISKIISSTRISYAAPFGYYSATAQYISGVDTILAVYGDETSKDYVDDCGEDCWELEEAYLDLEL